MKNIYPKSKGKIHPSPSAGAACSSSSAASSQVLTLLPVTVLALVSVLCADDREVLAYLILRSAKPPSLLLEEARKCKRPPAAAHRPLLDCPCFDCYTSFWLRWDSSPNRELIHQAIDAFDDHLARREAPRPKPRKKDRRLSAAQNLPPPPPAASDGDDTPAAQPEETAAPAEPPRKAWPDVMGMFNSRLWGLWSPSV